MIDSIMLVDDEDLFHLVFEDACSLLDITLSLLDQYYGYGFRYFVGF